jgi:Ala-tRNA(Pro) deacylase
MDARNRLETYLRENGVAFEVQEHPTAFTAQKIAASEHVPGRMFAKVVMAAANGDLVMLVLPAPSVVDVAKASELLGKPVRLASESHFATAFPTASRVPCRRSGTCTPCPSTSTSPSDGRSGSCSRREHTA